ncbi:hypothetical protein AADZ91_16475 [Colwelliaceae bacterium 6441]
MQSHSESRLQYDMVKIVSVLAYLSIVGWLVAVLLYGNHKSALARFHLRQALGLIITGSILAFIPLIGWLLAIGVLFLWCRGLFDAINGHRRLLPIINNFYQEHFDFIK